MYVSEYPPWDGQQYKPWVFNVFNSIETLSFILACVQKCNLLTGVLPWVPAPVGARHLEIQGKTAVPLHFCTQHWLIIFQWWSADD